MKRSLAIVLVITNLSAALWAASSLMAHAQIVDTLQVVHAYTGADPVDPDRLGLATPDGRFAIRPVQGCDWLAPYQQINTYPNWAVPPWLGLSGTDASEPGCIVRVEGRMDTTPCFTNADGLCDLAAEYGEP